MANIFLLEDDRDLNAAVALALEHDGHAVTRFYTLREAMANRRDSYYDLYLLDINLPDGSGIDLCEALRKGTQAPILFLTANDSERDMLRGYQSGCDDYIAKPFSLAVLCKKVQVLLNRTGAGDAKLFRYLDFEMDLNRPEVRIAGEMIRLTQKEYRILKCLIENRKKVLTHTMLLEQVWDIDGNFVDESALRVAIRRLRHKLHDDDQRYIVTVFGIGYTFGE
ncbi:MAG TPA: response regulator transcription factor [Candidatus Onthovicinus excrementipullorum]|nr:response regulator transcription factor [Candidatus Onthovicinus excrementipullorum]